MLFTGEPILAEEALQLGMVNTVVDGSELTEKTMELARKVARRPTMGLTLAKQAVNQALDAQGMWSAVQAAYSLHILGHSHNMVVHDGLAVDPDSFAVIRALVNSRTNRDTTAS